MELDHASGVMTGKVLSGRFSGRALADLSLADLLVLRAECAGDASSLAVLDSYLDRTQPADWRAQTEAAGGPQALRRLTVQFRGIGRPEEPITITSTVREADGARAIVVAKAVQGGKAIIRGAEAEIAIER